MLTSKDLRGIAKVVTEPIKGSTDVDVYDHMLERVFFSFEQANVRRLPTLADVELITTVVFKPFEGKVGSDDLALVRKRFFGALAGFTANDRKPH